VKLPKRVAHGAREKLFPRDEQHRHVTEMFARLLVALDLPDQGHARAAAFILPIQVQGVVPGLVERLSAQTLLCADACGQGLAETVVEQARRDARQDLHLLWLLKDEDSAGTAHRVLRNLDLQVAADDRCQFAQQSSGVAALPAAGREMMTYGYLC